MFDCYNYSISYIAAHKFEWICKTLFTVFINQATPCGVTTPSLRTPVVGRGGGAVGRALLFFWWCQVMLHILVLPQLEYDLNVSTLLILCLSLDRGLSSLWGEKKGERDEDKEEVAGNAFIRTFSFLCKMTTSRKVSLKSELLFYNYSMSWNNLSVHAFSFVLDKKSLISKKYFFKFPFWVCQ